MKMKSESSRIIGLQSKLAKKSRNDPKHSFEDLENLLGTPNWVTFAFVSVLRDTGGVIPGIEIRIPPEKNPYIRT